MMHGRFLFMTCLLVLILLATGPALAAVVTCPSTCSCLLPAEAAKIKTPGLCGGKQMVCGSDGKINKYCYQKPVTTTTVVPSFIVTGYHAFTTTPTTVIPSGTPDLVIDDVYTDAWPSFREIRYIIRNRGTGASAAGTTRIYIDGAQAGEDPVAALNAGQSRVETFASSGTCSGSSDIFGATADSAGVIAESDETNNARQREFACPAVTVLPDVALLDIFHAGERNFTYGTRSYTPVENIRFHMKSSNTSGPLSTDARLFIDGTWVSTTTATATTTRDSGWEGQFGYTGICSGDSDTIRVVLDPSDTLHEQNEANNELTVTWDCPVTPATGQNPDLVIRRFWTTPMGDFRYRIGYEIKNQGKEYTPFTETGLYIDRTYRIQDGVDPLAPGESRDEEFWWNYSTQDDCSGHGDELRLVADHDNRVNETNEDNNDYELEMTCVERTVPVTPRPDLVIGNVWTECTPPCSQYVIRYTIRNRGSVAAGESVTGLNINYHDTGFGHAPALEPGAESTERFVALWTPEYPDNFVQVCADRDNAVNEIAPAPDGELNNCINTTWNFNFTCDDNVQDRDETGVDCGGSYCPPCAACTTGAKWAPSDTPCTHAWPTSDGPTIGMNTESDSCNLVEVCDPDLDYIIRDAITCAEHADYDTRYTGLRASEKSCACRAARAATGIDTDYNPASYKRTLAQYLIYAFGSCHAYMQGYFHGEWCCYGYKDWCPDTCHKWSVDPPAWRMGTSLSCDTDPDYTPDFQMGGHRCAYYNTFLFGWKIPERGYWNSDTSYESNSDSAADVPAHASIDRLSTGTCVDYSFALTTMLRKAGFSRDDIFSVNGDEHAFNLLRFPGETKFHYVDTTGNRGDELMGGTGNPAIYNASGFLVVHYDYCRKMDEGCSNDYYGEAVSRCPSNNNIYSCEGIAR
jgi:subtilase family serine protease